MKYVVYGAGAVGGVLGARLHQAGHEVALIARGAHYAAIRDRGLRLDSPEGIVDLPIAVYDEPAAVGIDAGDVVLLAMKSQDTEAALRALAACAPADIAIVCAQNGVANERAALRMFPAVYGMCVICPAQHLEPGVVVSSASPVFGILDLGRAPVGVDATAERIAAALHSARFESEPRTDIMRWKYRKLLKNLSNVPNALCGSHVPVDVARAATAEAKAVLATAGIDVASGAEDMERRGDAFQFGSSGLTTTSTISGSSTWQSLARGTGQVEADYLNGEIVLLGRLHGVPTPINEALRQLANRAAREGWPAGAMSPDELTRLTLGPRG